MAKKNKLLILLAFVAVPVIFLVLYVHRTSLPLLAELPADSGPILIEHAAVFTGRPSDRVLDKVNILVRDGAIAKISETEIRADDARKIDASGKMVIPGLIDAHTHVQLTTASSGLPALRNLERNLSAFLYAGVTTVLDMGGDLRDFEKTAKALEKNEMSGPRLFYPGPMLTARGGHPAAMIRLTVFWPLRAIAIATMVREIGPETDVDTIIAENTMHGARWTKIMRDDIPLGVPCLDVKDLKRIAAASAGKGVPVIAHVASEEDINVCLDAGIRCFAHGPNMSALTDATIARMKKAGAVVCATLAVYDTIVMLTEKRLAFTPMDRVIADPGDIEEYLGGSGKKSPGPLKEWGREVLKFRDIKFDNIRRMKLAGIPIIAGSDSPNKAMVPGSSIHRELELLVRRCGFTPLEAVAAATSVTAEHYSALMGNGRYGRIFEGAPADLVILEKDFRNDIRNTTLISAVLQKGRLVRRVKP